VTLTSPPCFGGPTVTITVEYSNMSDVRSAPS
jgi:hypothetical protein